ncbi:MAG: DUF3105 domain-containing protein, partial [Patescibacteria group bacterium]|nr:DUF3105 domain-containing protein [Patescibacteria group bacterium]
ADHDPYTSNPPTSGPHYPDAIKAGVYDEPVAEEYLVHNMEHGHVILWYHCPVETPAQGEDATARRGGADEGGSRRRPTEDVKTGAQLRESCADAVTG